MAHDQNMRREFGLRKRPQAVQKYPKELSDQLVFNQVVGVTHNPLFSGKQDKG